jgi:hypothetical protein
MWVSILSILAYLVPFILDAWQASSPERKKEAEDAEIQKVRTAIATGDVAIVNSAVDRLLCDGDMPTTGTASDSAGQQHSADSTAKGISDLLRTKIVLRQ